MEATSTISVEPTIKPIDTSGPIKFDRAAHMRRVQAERVRKGLERKAQGMAYVSGKPKEAA